ncbi:amidohydrolase family protein [Wenyingzhuangia sp. 1_MG-2023]|nr:amidohydrolase family protein [Wenyingzhuangia sp. 1_MG-2023]
MERVIKGIHYKTKQPVEITLDNGLIAEIESNPTLKSEKTIAPGLVDLQINGFRGVDFNEEELQESDVVKITEYLWQEGVTSYYPTLITNSDCAVCTALETIVSACEKDIYINKTISGIHLEGPFLSLEDGPRGAHPLKYVKAPDWNLFCKWQKLAKGKIKMITLSPEWPEAIAFIKQCVASGVIAAIGHTAASSEQIKEAVLAGARVSTHLGNASHATLPRHANYIWEQLAAEDLWATIIADGFHLPKSVLSVFVKVKGEKCVLVSDATRFAGLPSGSYSSHIGGEIELNDDGKLFIKDNPNMLAGSAQSLCWCVDHLVNSEIATLSTALDMASIKVQQLLGEKGAMGLEKNAIADVIVFERTNNKINILKTIKAGKVVYTR